MIPLRASAVLQVLVPLRSAFPNFSLARLVRLVGESYLSILLPSRRHFHKLLQPLHNLWMLTGHLRRFPHIRIQIVEFLNLLALNLCIPVTTDIGVSLVIGEDNQDIRLLSTLSNAGNASNAKRGKTEKKGKKKIELS